MNEDVNLGENTEIEKALKEFETENNEQTTQVPVVSTLKDSENSKMAQLVIKYSGGLIKEQKQAEYFLLGICVVCIVGTIIVFTSSSTKTSQKPTAKTIENMKQTAPVYTR